MKHGHNHGEAFALMTYGCPCGHREVIWNSRDGVTPFCMGCPSCGGATLRHSTFRVDVYAPAHKLHRGQRFWRDGTPDEAAELMRKRIAAMQGRYPLRPSEVECYINDARTGANSEFQTGWPMLAVHPY